MRGIVLVVLLLLAVAHYHYDYRRYFVFILNLIHYLIYINNIHTCIDHILFDLFSLLYYTCSWDPRILHMVCEMERSLCLRNLTITAAHVYIPHAYTYSGFLGSGFEISELGEVYIQSTYHPNLILESGVSLMKHCASDLIASDCL